MAPAVIARSACDEAIHLPFVPPQWIASLSLAMTAHTPPHPRGAMRPSYCKTFRPEGVGNAGCPVHPQPRVRWVVGVCTRVFTAVAPEITRHPPHAMVLTVCFALSPVIGLSCHRHCRTKGLSAPGWADLPSDNLTPASRRQDHTTSPSATEFVVRVPFDRSRVVKPALHHVSGPTLLASTASRPASVTIAIRPSSGTRQLWICR
jgi:hypothetical protein